MSGPVPVTFAPIGRTVWIQPGETVLSAARRAGVLIPAPCGGRGICGGCGVRVVEGELAQPDELEARGFAFAPPGVRLGCRARISGAVTVRPVVAPPAPRPSAGERADETDRALVAAVDLGTTTVAAVVVDRATGAEVGRGLAPNHQAAWGADVLSRVSGAIAGEADDLRAAAEASVLEALAGACDQGATCVASITRLVIAGNTAMAALLLGVDVSPLAGQPFALPYEDSPALSPSSPVVGALADDAATRVLPALGGFIGGDVTVGLTALGTGLTTPERLPRLFVDLGTNAEIVCATRDGLFAASAAAGPAFEGYGIRSGGPALPGAIERVEYAGGTLLLRVIGSGTPQWLCGSGLVSAIAVLRRLGHLDAEGRLRSTGPLESRFGVQDDVACVALTEQAEDEVAVVLTQRDVRAFQLAKGAVLAATRAVLHESGVKSDDVREATVAGAFGAALEVADLVELGVLPASLAGKVRFAGNTALAGATMIALDASRESVATEIASSAQRLELAEDPDFTAGFLEALALVPMNGA